MIQTNPTAPPELDRFQRLALITGIIGLAIGGAWAIFDSQQFFRSYLLAYVFWIGFPLGCFAILMVQHLSGGSWGVIIRRVLEASTRTFIPLLILFVPIVFGLKSIYSWARPEVVHGDHMLEQKAVYLNVWFFLARVAFYFAVWIGISYVLNRYSRKQDETHDSTITRSMQNWSGPGLVLYGLTVTFASIDWVMSLDPKWYSTIFGILFMGGQGVSAMSFVIACVVLLARYKPMSEVVQPRHLHDLGKLLLAFIMLWAYFSFSQFLIIWSGNLPEEVTWYAHRLHGGWKYMGLAIVIFHFALPFVLLLSRDLKRNGRTLAAVAIMVIVIRLVDLFWLTAPELYEGSFKVSPTDLILPIGLGGIWLWFFVDQLKKRPLLPIGDPGLQDAIAHHGGGH